MRSPCTATKSSPCSLQLEKACMQQRRLKAAKNKLKKKKSGQQTLGSGTEKWPELASFLPSSCWLAWDPCPG